RDVYNLRLGADLVVLSGCESSLGKEVRGEGLVGLTQGFLYAGARPVVASLWRVEDQATSELTAHFYGGLLAHCRAQAPALRPAPGRGPEAGTARHPGRQAMALLLLLERLRAAGGLR